MLKTKRPIFKPKSISWKDPLYICWKGMMRRCYDKRSKDYIFYGGRGIIVCEKWHVFISFREDMLASHSKGLSIDRIDVNGNYSPQNCRWATMKEQCLNRRSNHKLTDPITGKEKTIQEWADMLGVNRRTITSRISRGYKDFNLITKVGSLPKGPKPRRIIR